MDYKPGLVAASLFQGKKKSPAINPALDQLFSKKTETVTKVQKQNGKEKQKSKKNKVKNIENGDSLLKTGNKRKSGDTQSVPTQSLKKAKLNNSQDNDDFPFVHESLLTKSKSPQQKTEKKKKSKKEDEDNVATTNRTRKRRNKTADKRTIFIGNCPLSTDKKTITKLFREYGSIESIRFRCGPPAKLELPKRAIIIKKEFHEKGNCYVCYVVFEKQESAQKALEKNGYVLDHHHLRVDVASNTKKHDKKRSVFVGNLPFDVKEEDLRSHFEDCGDIENVRIVRDRQTSIGKGIAYVQFESKDGVTLAKKLNESEFGGRKLRVTNCTNKPKPEKTTDKLQTKFQRLNNKNSIKSSKPDSRPEKKKKMTFAPSNRKSGISFQEILQAKKDKRVNRMKKKKKLGSQKKKSDGLSSIFGDMSSDMKKLKMDNPKFRDKKTKEQKMKAKDKAKKKSKKSKKTSD